MNAKSLKRKAKIALVPGLMLVAAAFLLSFFSLGNFNLLAATYNSPNTLITANIVVTSVCYISLPGSISFSNVYAGGNTLTNVGMTDTDTGGNSAANILLAGNTLWVTATAGSYNSFYIQNTLWDSTSDSSFTGTHLTNSLVDTKIQVPAPTQSSPTQSATVYFGLAVPGGTLASDAGTSYSTTIVVEDSC